MGLPAGAGNLKHNIMQHPLLFFCKANAEFPNSPLPVILYRQALHLPFFFKASYVRKLFVKHHWANSWNGGVFTYDHYHSTTDEVLGFYKGSTTLLLGGENCHRVQVEKGDILVIPAGVAHKNLGKEHQVKCVGAYPDGREYDIMTGRPGERPVSEQHIAALPVPDEDPFYGSKLGLPSLWSLARFNRVWSI